MGLGTALWGWSRGLMRGRGLWKGVFLVAHPVVVASHLLCLPRKLEPGAPGRGEPPIRSPGGGGVVFWVSHLGKSTMKPASRWAGTPAPLCF